jgi:hypothetical protein
MKLKANNNNIPACCVCGHLMIIIFLTSFVKIKKLMLFIKMEEDMQAFDAEYFKSAFEDCR